MNKTLKWVLIGLGIAVLAFLIALPLFSMHRLGFSMMSRLSRSRAWVSTHARHAQ